MKKILIIEDEAAYSKLLQYKLTAKGYKVIEAADGKKGLAMAKKEMDAEAEHRKYLDSGLRNR